MTISVPSRRHFLGLALPVQLLATWLLAATASAGSPAPIQGWQLERDVDPPSYAVTEPVQSNLNIDTVVLACSEAAKRRFLRFEVYLKESGPLLPVGADPSRLRSDPRAQIAIDGQIFPVTLSFAEVFVVLADAVDHQTPVLSERLLDALERGRTMTLRFALLAKGDGDAAEFDGEATIDLQSGSGGSAVAAVRRCAPPASSYRVSRIYDQRGPVGQRLVHPRFGG